MSNAKKLMQAASGVSADTGQTFDTVFIMAFDIATAIDVTDASNMSVLDSVTGSAGTTNLSPVQSNISGLANNHAFVAGGSDDTFVSVNVSDTSNLSIADVFTDGTDLDRPQGTCVDDSIDRAWVTSDDDGKILTINISDPANMAKTSVATSTSSDRGLLIDTERSYVFGLGTSRITAFTYNSSGVLAQQNFLNIDSDGHAINTSTQHIYGSSKTADRIEVCDYSTITSLSEVETFTDATNLTEPTALAVDSTNNKLVVLCTDPGRLTVLDISDPTSLSVNGTLANSDLTSSSEYGGVVLDTVNQIAYCTIFSNKVTAFDYSGSGNPSLLGNITLSGLAGYSTSIIGFSR